MKWKKLLKIVILHKNIFPYIINIVAQNHLKLTS